MELMKEIENKLEMVQLISIPFPASSINFFHSLQSFYQFLSSILHSLLSCIRKFHRSIQSFFISFLLSSLSQFHYIPFPVSSQSSNLLRYSLILYVKILIKILKRSLLAISKFLNLHNSNKYPPQILFIHTDFNSYRLSCYE